MVLGVCRRVLPNLQDAEDVRCQATFLIFLARKARGHNRAGRRRWRTGSTPRRKVLTQCPRGRSAGEARRESLRAAVPEVVQAVDGMSGRELLAALDDELDRLPASLPQAVGTVLSGRADPGRSGRPAGACRQVRSRSSWSGV